jgi:hypothetical protein
MEVDESMGEDAISIAYFDRCVFPSSFSRFPCVGRAYGRFVRSGFCNTRIKEIYFRYGGRLCHRTTTLTMEMILIRILQMTRRGSRKRIARSHRV